MPGLRTSLDSSGSMAAFRDWAQLAAFIESERSRYRSIVSLADIRPQ